MARVFRSASLLLAAATTATAFTCTELSPSGTPPSARQLHAVVLDVDTSGTSRLLIHGGSSTDRYDDLWAYDLAGNSWTEITPSGGTKPGARDGHVAAVDTSGGRLLIHGGNNDQDDLWAYDIAGSSWTEITPSGGTKPAGRAYHVAAMDTSGGRLLIHGGQFGDGDFDDLWAYDLAGNTWAEITPTSNTKPRARHLHVAAVDTSGGRLLIHGGNGGKFSSELNDLWEYDLAGSSWTEITPSGTTKPAGRNSHVAAMDTSSGRLLIHGGMGFTGGLHWLNDLWEYDLVGNSWAEFTPTSGTNPLVSGHAASLAGGKLIIFGGYRTSGGMTNDLLEFARVTSTSTSTTTNSTTATTSTSTTVTATVTATLTATATVTATFTLPGQIGAAPAICRPSTPAMFYALFCVASLAIM